MLPCSLAFASRILKNPCVGHQKKFRSRGSTQTLLKMAKGLASLLIRKTFWLQTFGVKPKLLPAFSIFCTAFRDAPDRMDIHRRHTWLVEEPSWEPPAQKWREWVGVMSHQDCRSCPMIPSLIFETVGSGSTNRRMNKWLARPCMCAKTTRF